MLSSSNTTGSDSQNLLSQDSSSNATGDHSQTPSQVSSINATGDNLQSMRSQDSSSNTTGSDSQNLLSQNSSSNATGDHSQTPSRDFSRRAERANTRLRSQRCELQRNSKKCVLAPKKNNKRKKQPSSSAHSTQEVGKAEKKLSKQKKRSEAADVSAIKADIPHSIRTRKRKKPTKDDIEKKTEDVSNEQNADGVNERGRVAVERGLKCIICQDAETYTAFITLPCNHQFHSLCIERWRREKNCCPHCKMSLLGWSTNGRMPRIRYRGWVKTRSASNFW